MTKNRESEKHRNFQRFMREYKRRQSEKDKIHREYHIRMNEFNRRSKDFEWYHRHIKFTRPIIVIFNFVIWYLLFKHLGLKAISLFFAGIMCVGGSLQFLFFIRLEKRIFKPISKLKAGVEEIAKGNYDVKVESEVFNEIGVLVDSFNKMAEKLKDGERVKQEYEENRKLLIANISHDLKTPITSIQGYIETMWDRKDLPQEDINRYHQIIYTNAGYMNKLIDDLFLFSKLDMDKLELNLECIKIKAFMADLMEEFKLELDDSKVKFEYEDNIAEEVYTNIDMKRISQVFRNIIGNAVKYGAEEVSIWVKLYMKEEGLFIDIANNGPRIPEDKLPYIFDRFYRVDQARTKDLMSTGLGLAISKELVEAHGGKISVISSEDDGTCFTITLPIVQVL